MGSYDFIPAVYRDKGVFTAFDLETTGLDPKQDRIVEIGALKFDKRGPVSRFSVLINPGIPMPAEAGRVNNITDEMLRGKPSLDQIFSDFIGFIGDTILIAHNAPFDCGFINEKLKDRFEGSGKREEDPAQGSLLDDPGEDPEGEKHWKAPFPSLPNRIVNTLVYAKEVFPGRYKYNLQDLARSLGIGSVDAHRAEDDARVCMEIFVRCVEESPKSVQKT
jgi:DNA polymerase-3 subunit epsilon